MRMRQLVGFLALSVVSGVAFAQPGADPSEPPPPPPQGPPPAAYPPPPPPQVVQPVPVEQPSTVDKGIVEDANAGRSFLTPTALTEPAGTFSFSDYELLLAGVHYSPTDELSLSATTLLPVVEDMPFWLLLNAKFQFLRAGNVRAVVQGALTYVSDDGSATAAVLGGALTYCIDVDCYSTITGYVGAGFAHEDQSAVPIVASGAVALRLAKHVKFLAEADTGYIAGDINEAANGFLGWYGFRFTGREIGVDLGFVKPVCTDDDDDCDGGLVLGVPFISFTYRSLKD